MAGIEWKVTLRSADRALLGPLPLVDAALIPMSELRPVRVLKNHRKQARRPGLLHFASSRKLVFCRSRLAMRVLRVLDFDRGIKDALAQPFTLHRGDAVRGLRPPDFLIELHGGGRVAVDVVTEKALGTKAHARRAPAMEAAAASVGWQYRALGDPDPVTYANIAWLAGYRRPSINHERYGPALLDACEQRTTIREALHRVRGPEALVRPVLFHLMWRQELVADLTALLSETSEVWTLEASS